MYGSPVVVLKGLSLAIGFIVLVIGLHSHYQSAWVKKVDLGSIPDPDTGDEIPIEIQPYKLCALVDLAHQFLPKLDIPKCPSISLERYFVAIIIICFLLSLGLFIGGFVVELESHPLNKLDMVCHILACVLLLIGSIVYIVSARQVKNLLAFDPVPDDDTTFSFGNLRTSEKLGAAAMGIIQSALYGGVAAVIMLA